MKKISTKVKFILLSITLSIVMVVPFIVKELFFNRIKLHDYSSTFLLTDSMFENHLRDTRPAFDKITACHNSGYLVASSFHGHFVEVINISNGDTIALLGVPGTSGNSNGHFQNPHGVACDEKNNNIIIADSGNKRAIIYDLASFKFSFKIELEDYISDITVDSKSNRLFTLSGGSHVLGGCCNVVAINRYNEDSLSKEIIIPMRKKR